MKKALVTIVTVSLLNASQLRAEKFTLRDCEDYALKHNREYLSALEEKKKASLGYTLSWQFYLPQLSTSFSYIFAEKLREFEIPPDSPFGQMLDLARNLNLVPEGSTGGGKFVIDFTYDYTLSLKLVQPIFNTKIILGINTAYLGRKAAEEKVRQVKNKVLFQVRTLFFQVLLAEKLVNVAQEALNLAKEQLRVAQSKFDAGEATEYEVLRNKVEVANAEVKLIQAKNRLEKARLYLAAVMGLDDPSTLELEGELKEVEFSKTCEDLIDKALKLRPELKAMDYFIEIKKREELSSVLEYVPSLALVGNTNFYTNDLSGKWYRDYSFVLAAQWDIFSGGRKVTKKMMARAEVEKLAQQKKLLMSSVEAEVKAAFLDLKEARETLSSTRETLQTALRTVEIARERYASGLLTSLELMDAQMALTRARTAYYAAVFKYRQAIEKIKLASGIIDLEE